MTASDITVPDYLTSGTTIGRIWFIDTDYMDNRSLIISFTQTSQFYSTDKSSGNDLGGVSLNLKPKTWRIYLS